MQTIAIVNRRGGVGKTVTAHAIGAGLKRRGYKVLFVDLDSQGNLTFDAATDGTRLNAFDVLADPAKARAAVVGDMIPGGQELSAADVRFMETGKEYRLKEALQQLAGSYDFCVIDTPPALGILTTNALTAADGVIIPAQAEIHSLQGISLLYETISTVKKYCNAALKVYGIVLTRYNARTNVSRDMREALEENAALMGTKVYSAPIRQCTAIQEAQAMQQDVFEYAPRSNAAKDYDALIDELLQDIGGGHNGKAKAEL